MLTLLKQTFLVTVGIIGLSVVVAGLTLLALGMASWMNFVGWALWLDMFVYIFCMVLLVMVF